MKLQLQDVGFSYDGRRQIFQGIQFAVETGQVVCILGPNGIGKTTLLQCMAKLQKPNTGVVTIDGKDMETLSAQEVAQVIGYVPQMLQASFDYSVLEYVVTGRAPWLKTFEKPGESEYRTAKEALDKMEILHLAEHPYTRLSGGELQQVSIARAITQEAKLILMDEPTAHLDYGNQLKVLRMIKELTRQGFGVVLTTHNPDQVLLLDAQVAIFDRKSKFHFGPWKETLTDELLSSIYNVPLKMMDVKGVERKVCIAPKIEI